MDELTIAFHVWSAMSILGLGATAVMLLVELAVAGFCWHSAFASFRVEGTSTP